MLKHSIEFDGNNHKDLGIQNALQNHKCSKIQNALQDHKFSK